MPAGESLTSTDLPATNALVTIRVASIPLQWYAFEWAGLQCYEIL